MVAFAGLLLAPRASEAGCGDYVLISGGTSHASHDMTAGAAKMDGAAQAVDRQESRRPCHGPGCSKRSLPPAAPAPGVEISVERWAVTSPAVLSEVSCVYCLLAEPADLVAQGFRSSILRPPR